jgi:hypothetical protein
MKESKDQKILDKVNNHYNSEKKARIYGYGIALIISCIFWILIIFIILSIKACALKA